MRRKHLRLTHVPDEGTISRMPKKLPQPKQPERMIAATKFAEKVAGASPHGEIISTFERAGIPSERSKLANWLDGRIVQLDHAWLIARELGLSLDYLANDDYVLEPPGIKQPEAPELKATKAHREDLSPRRNNTGRRAKSRADRD